MKENRETISPSFERRIGRRPGHSEGSGPLDLTYLNLVEAQPGTMVNGRYRLERLIGKGGFGIVFEATDLTLKSRLAIKFLNPCLARNEQKFLRVKREINLSRRISDGRIVKVFSLEDWQGIHFLVMELAAGSNLRSLLQERGGIPWPEFKGIFMEILEAVDVLHRNGIVHRDLKPSNILIDAERKIKVLDFGLAKEVDDSEKTSTAGEIVGSPYFMSPEQIRGEKVDFRSDVYQLGLVLYRALAGRHPFEHTSTMEVILRQLNQRPEPLAVVNGSLPPFLRLGLEKALEKKPARRFRDAGAMAHFFEKESVSWPKRALFALSRGPVRWGLAALALAALGFLAYRATFGSRAVYELQPMESILEARNRFGVFLWQKDFSPFSVYQVFTTTSAVPLSQGAGIPSEYLTLDLGGGKVVAVLLVPHRSVVFPLRESIASSALMGQRVIMAPDGRVLRQEPKLADFEYDAYDYPKVIKPHSFRLLGLSPEGEAETLFTVQQYQSLFPFALVYGRGLRKFVFTHPGTFSATPLARNAQMASFMIFGINNLFAHMSFIAEITFNTLGTDHQLLRGIPNLSSDARNNVPYGERLFILPFRARLLEDRWQEDGRARFNEDTRGDILEIDREGRLTVQTRSGHQVFHDAPDTLRRVYTLVNQSYQERMVKNNPGNALALIVQALSFPLQNPYLRSALHYLQGDLEVELGSYERGERSLQRALEIFPGNNDACERLCEMEMLKGDVPAALRRLADSRSDSSQFWGFTSFGVQLFKGYIYLQAGLFDQADTEFEKVRIRIKDLGALCHATGGLFQGEYVSSLAVLRELEQQPLGNADLRELRLLLGRTLLLADSDLERAGFLFSDIFRNSLEYGHLAEMSTWYLLARKGRTGEARQNAIQAFDRLEAKARGDFMTRIWLFYDAYVFGRTMELAKDRTEAGRGYRACIAANPYTELADRSRQQLKRMRLTL